MARLYRRNLEDQGFEVLMTTVFDIAARHGYVVARRIVKDLAAVPNIPLREAWVRVLCHVGPAELKDLLAPDEQAKWSRAIETKMGETSATCLPRLLTPFLLTCSRSLARQTANANLRRWLRFIEE